MEKDYVSPVLNRFVTELAIPVTRQSIKDELQRHSDANSLFAFSDVLNKWNIPNAALKIEFEQLNRLPLPFVAHISNKEFAVVTQLNHDQATLSNSRYKDKVFTTDEFKIRYSGSALVAEKDENSGEPDYLKRRRKEFVENWRVPVVLTGFAAILISVLFFYSHVISVFSFNTVFLTLFKTGGLAVSILLLIQSIDSTNPLILKLCTGENNKDCNAILSSKAAKLTDELSWSEIGFFYFAGTWLVLLFNSNHLAVMQALAIINLVSLPYTFYSIYYQWRVAKQWCVLCCATQVLLWLEFFAFFPSLLLPLQTPNSIEWGNLIMAMLMPVLTWILIKPSLLKANQVAPLKQQLYKFKYNVDLFNKLLNEENKYALPAEDDSLIIGNREAENIITMVSNPYCQPCAKAHKALDEWMSGRNDVKLQIIFATDNGPQDKKAEVAAHLMSLRAARTDITLKKALNDWYEQKQKNYEVWAKKHPITKDIVSTDALNKQKQWCKLTEITGTPTLFLNGRRLPKNYQPEDLKYFI